MVISVAAIGWFLSGLAIAPVRESYQRLKQFTADASHELRNPIAIIQANVQVALADPDPELQLQRQQLEVIERLTRRLGRLVDNLLFLARQDSGMVQSRWVSLSLKDLIADVLEEQSTVAAAQEISLNLTVHPPTGREDTADQPPSPLGGEGGWVVQGDRDQLARLFTNLIGNAIQYTPVGGRIEVDLQGVRRSTTQQWLQIKVQDTGIGIAEEALPQIFDRFYRADPARTRRDGSWTVATGTGSGLGLAIAQAIVENHHGQIRVESTLSQGTTVKIILPKTRAEGSVPLAVVSEG
nr:HAMP domain-containing sensor histidine kinase [Neosynechococcus sphagnicola]